MSRTVAFALLASALFISAPAAQSLPPGAPGTVTLTRTDYDRLLDLASVRPRGADPAPVSAALTRADIRATVGATSVRASIRLDGEAFRPGVSKVVLIKNATLLDARGDARPLPVIAEGGAHVALVSGPATFSATLDLGAPIAYAPGRASFVLPVPNAGSATATIDVPGEQADVHVLGGLVLRRASSNGRTRIDATLAPGTQTEVWWSTHETAPGNPAAARDVRLLADVKSVVTIADADVRLVSLVNASIVQGEPSRIDLDLPSGYELESVSGSTVDRTEPRPGGVTVFVTDPAVRRHQFLVSLERAHTPGSFRLETGLPAVPAAQRETGEVAVEGLGTMEVSSPEMPGLRRIDVRELDLGAGSARDSLLAAYRYQRTGDEPAALTLDVKRFADAPVLAAVAERAVATTLVTAQGRALTEITLWIRNRAQSYMKVALPAGASIVSVEVGGAPAAPVEGADGSRVPLLRPGLRTDGLYAVSFAYLHGGTPFLKKGDMQMTLPPMDIPVNVVEWELFVPDSIRADRFDGNVIGAGLAGFSGIGIGSGSGAGLGPGFGGGVGGGTYRQELSPLAPAMPGQIAGRVLDSSGAPLPGVAVTIESGGRKQQLFTATDGSYVASNVAPGQVTVSGELQGFKNARRSVSQTGEQVDLTLEIAGVQEQVAVMAQSPNVNVTRDDVRRNAKMPVENEAISANMQNLQRRAAGVLPIRFDVPRAGASHRFVRPLVIDEETMVTFRYKRR